MRRSTLAGLLALLAAVVAGYLAREIAGPDDVQVSGPALPGDTHIARVQRVVDGDTVVLTGLGKVRMIGVDTPEVYGGEECFGERASRYAKDELTGQRVDYAVGHEERDRYGRLLAYLWLDDGRSFNAMLLAGGYARTLTIPPNDRYARSFAATAAKARHAGTGLWGACRGRTERDANPGA